MCPEVFQLNEDSVSEVHDPEWAPEEEIQKVIEKCPVECIHWEEE
jgi:ferredoxin